LFFDAGLAWDKVDDISFNSHKIADNKRFPVFSTGVSMRINLFGAMVLEPYYAFPFIHKGISQGFWGLNFLPGW